MNYYLKYSDFKKFCKKREKPLPNWRINLYYPFVWLVCFLFFITVISIIRSVMNTPSRKYPSEKYRKVVKEGVFWDTVEYHER